MRNTQSFGLSSICVVFEIDKTGTVFLKLETKWKTTYLFGCWIRISSDEGLYLWLLGVLVYLNLFGIETVENSLGVKWIPRDFTRNIQSFDLGLICVVCDIDETQRIQY